MEHVVLVRCPCCGEEFFAELDIFDYEYRDLEHVGIHVKRTCKIDESLSEIIKEFKEKAKKGYFELPLRYHPRALHEWIEAFFLKKYHGNAKSRIEDRLKKEGLFKPLKLHA